MIKSENCSGNGNDNESVVLICRDYNDNDNV